MPYNLIIIFFTLLLSSMNSIFPASMDHESYEGERKTMFDRRLYSARSAHATEEDEPFPRDHSCLTADENVFAMRDACKGKGPSELGKQLLQATKLNKQKMVSVLLESEADVNATSNCEHPLLVATKNGHVQIVEKILQTCDVELDKVVDASDYIQDSYLSNSCYSERDGLVPLNK